MSVVLRVENLSKFYSMSGEQSVKALENVNFSVEKGDLVAILGESGSGKSTLLHLLGALELPSSGYIWLKDVLLTQASPRILEELRLHSIGFVFQHNNLLSDFTALENVCFPALIRGESFKKAKKRASSLLGSVGLKKRERHYPSQLSGGEQQRVAISRALMNEPDLLLADEPTGNLDSKTAQTIYEVLAVLRKEFGTTIIVVTHSLQFLKLASRTIEIQDGRIVHDY